MIRRELPDFLCSDVYYLWFTYIYEFILMPFQVYKLLANFKKPSFPVTASTRKQEKSKCLKKLSDNNFFRSSM